MTHLQDTDKMPWGKHKGIPMQHVPSGKEHDRVCPVADYIRRNIVDALRMEHSDGIW